MAAQTKSNCEKFRILRRVIYKVSEEKNNDNKDEVTNLSNADRAVKYTGLHWNVLQELNQSVSFATDIKEVNRLDVYFVLMNFYLTQKTIPTTRKLFNALYKKIPEYIDIASFRKMLVKMDFIWKKSQYGCMFVIERPEVVMERYHYLNSISQYRLDNKLIYFVDENALEATTGYLSFDHSNRLAKAAPYVIQQRVIYCVSKNGIHCTKFIENFDADTLEKWIIEDLLPFLSSPSLIVLNHSKHHCRKIAETPTLDSLRIEMTKWLELNSVPFDSDMSKYELFSLIETCTDLNENMYKIDRIIETYGHRVLRIPKCIKNITPAKLINQIISKNAKQVIFEDTNTMHERVLNNFNEFIVCIPVLKFIECDDVIKKHEYIILNTDKGVDIVFDHLLQKISCIHTNDENDSEIPSCGSDSE